MAKKRRKLTDAEVRKVREIADDIHRENPGIDTEKKFRIATAAVKKHRKGRNGFGRPI